MCKHYIKTIQTTIIVTFYCLLVFLFPYYYNKLRNYDLIMHLFLFTIIQPCILIAHMYETLYKFGITKYVPLLSCSIYLGLAFLSDIAMIINNEYNLFNARNIVIYWVSI